MYTENFKCSHIVERVGKYAFFVMTGLILVCIGIGFIAVYEAKNKMTWDEACIAQGGVPIKIDDNFDCKSMKGNL